MSRFHRILLVLDPSMTPTPALDRAVSLARAEGAALWIGLFDRGPRLGALALLNPTQCERIERFMRDQLGQQLQALCERLSKQGLTVHAIDRCERPSAQSIVAQVEDHRIDLLVKDAGHDSGLRRLVFVPLDWELLRTCPVPIWMAGPTPSAFPRRVVAAVDPGNPEHGAGPLNDSLLATAQHIARIGKGHVTILSAFTGLPPLLEGLQPSAVPVDASFEDLYAQLREAHRKSLAGLLQRHGLKQDDAVVLNGGAAKAVLGALEGHPGDVLVVGMIRRHGLDRLVMGSTVEQIVGQAPCDVLAVPAVSVKVAVTSGATASSPTA